MTATEVTTGHIRKFSLTGKELPFVSSIYITELYRRGFHTVNLLTIWLLNIYFFTLNIYISLPFIFVLNIINQPDTIYLYRNGFYITNLLAIKALFVAITLLEGAFIEELFI